MTQTAYKVVAIRNGERTSITQNDLPTGWALTYTPGERVTAQQGSKIFVFQNKGAAQVFAYYHLYHPVSPTQVEIWECECENLTKPTGGYCLNLWWSDALANLQAFWENACPVMFCCQCPLDTVLADAVTLTKLMDPPHRTPRLRCKKETPND
jgi:hypothetical protein